jgi:hypothetical protein
LLLLLLLLGLASAAEATMNSGMARVEPAGKGKMPADKHHCMLGGL